MDENKPKKLRNSIIPVIKPNNEIDYDKVLKDLDNFHHSIFSYLAETANYELISTENEDGTFLEEDDYSFLRTEALKDGIKILYYYQINKNIIVLNPRTAKTLIITEGEPQTAFN